MTDMVDNLQGDVLLLKHQIKEKESELKTQKKEAQEMKNLASQIEGQLLSTKKQLNEEQRQVTGLQEELTEFEQASAVQQASIQQKDRQIAELKLVKDKVEKLTQNYQKVCVELFDRKSDQEDY